MSKGSGPGMRPRVGLKRAAWLFAAFLLWTALVAMGTLDGFDGTIGPDLVQADDQEGWEVVSDLGDTVGMGVLVAAAILVGLLRRDLVGAAFAGAIPLAGWGVGRAIKWMVGRPRPDWALLEESSLAYPSNHTFVGWLFWVCVLWVLARNTRWQTRAALIGVAPAVTVAYSRLALGVHHVSDLVGAWLLGLSVLLTLPWLTSQADAWWQRRQGTSQTMPDGD